MTETAQKTAPRSPYRSWLSVWDRLLDAPIGHWIYEPVGDHREGASGRTALYRRWKALEAPGWVMRTTISESPAGEWTLCLCRLGAGE